MNLTLSIILSPSHTSTDLGVGGGSADQSRQVFALLQVIGEGENLRLPRHQGRNRINSLAPSVGTIQSFLQKKNLEMVTGRMCLFSTMDLHRSVYIYGRSVLIFIKNFLYMFSSATKIKSSRWGFDRGCGGGVTFLKLGGFPA
jgi:hypothetical protein